MTNTGSEGTIRREPKYPQLDDIFQLRVSLIDIEPAIWRRLLVPKDIVLPRLHGVIQAVMGWTDSHLHQFKVGDLHFAEPDEEFDSGPIDYRRISLNQIAPRQGSTCIYEYDFGDSWDHLIEVEGELGIEDVTTPLPVCLAGQRACPPEDCGGPAGYGQLLDAIADPDHPEHESLSRWIGGGFDAELFDLEKVNWQLKRHVVPTRRR